jgi:hypothetical protein
MCYHSKGYQHGLQGWPTNVRLRTTCIFVGSQFTFFHCLISCLHQCFANLNFSSQFSNKQHFYFCDICTLAFVFVFMTVSVKTWSFEVTLKSSMNCRYHSCRYAYCVYILLIIMQLARSFDLYSFDIL